MAKDKNTGSNQMSLFDIFDSASDDMVSASQMQGAHELIEEKTQAAIEKVMGPNAVITASQRETISLVSTLRTGGAAKKAIKAKLAKTPDAHEGSMDVIEALDEEFGVDEIDAHGEQNDDLEDAEADATQNRAHTRDSVLGMTRFMASLGSARFDPPTEVHERELGLRIISGDMKARDELVTRSMRFAISRARQYIKSGRPFEDLVQGASEGLLIAANKFNPDLGRFTTVAGWWIRQRLQRTVAADSALPIPSYLYGEEKRLNKLAAEETDVAEREKLQGKAIRAAKIYEARKAFTVSLDATRGGDDSEQGTNLMSMLESEEPSQEDRYEQMKIIQKLNELAGRLGDERKEYIFRRRIGIHPDAIGHSSNFAEIGKDLNLSRERVRTVFDECAKDIAQALVYWAKGEHNLPSGLYKSLVNSG
jgi:RNA polymerase sigma factor (sigma-70 family)